MISRVQAEETIEDMIMRIGGELQVELDEMAIGEDPELEYLQKQNNCFRDSWAELGEAIPADHRTNFETGSGFKGAEGCNEPCNNFEQIVDSKTKADSKIQDELAARDFELDPNNSPRKQSQLSNRPRTLIRVRGSEAKGHGCQEHQTVPRKGVLDI